MSEKTPLEELETSISDIARYERTLKEGNVAELRSEILYNILPLIKGLAIKTFVVFSEQTDTILEILEEQGSGETSEALYEMAGQAKALCDFIVENKYTIDTDLKSAALSRLVATLQESASYYTEEEQDVVTSTIEDEKAPKETPDDQNKDN